MLQSQPTLFPDPARCDPAWLERMLDEHRGWITAGDILIRGGLEDTDAGRREIRKLASESLWIISGQRGYRHIKHGTAEEIDHACTWLVSQGKAMIRRSIAMRRRAHSLVG